MIKFKLLSWNEQIREGNTENFKFISSFISLKTTPKQNKVGNKNGKITRFDISEWWIHQYAL